jgi:hypothetical protein
VHLVGAINWVQWPKQCTEWTLQNDSVFQSTELYFRKSGTLSSKLTLEAVFECSKSRYVVLQTKYDTNKPKECYLTNISNYTTHSLLLSSRQIQMSRRCGKKRQASDVKWNNDHHRCLYLYVPYVLHDICVFN